MDAYNFHFVSEGNCTSLYCTTLSLFVLNVMLTLVLVRGLVRGYCRQDFMERRKTQVSSLCQPYRALCHSLSGLRLSWSFRTSRLPTWNEFPSPFATLTPFSSSRWVNIWTQIQLAPCICLQLRLRLNYISLLCFALLDDFVCGIASQYFDKETGKGAAWSRISSIPTEELDPLKKFLDEQEIKYYEGPKNLVWDNILENIREDFEVSKSKTYS